MLTYKIIDFDQNKGQLKIIVNEYDFGIIPIDLIPDSEGRFPTGEQLDNYIRGFIPEHEIERLEKVRNAVNANDILALVQTTETPPTPTTVEPNEVIFII